MLEDSEYYVSRNVFSKDIVDLLYISCKKHFIYNLCGKYDTMTTNAIIDCHGLALSPNVVFPYYENHWNIYCMKVKKIVSDYCKIMNLNKNFLVPHSCWSERSVDFSKEYPDRINQKIYYDSLHTIRDEWIENHLSISKCYLIRTVYFLKNSDHQCGTTIKYPNNRIVSIPAEENSIHVFICGDNLVTNKFPTNTEEKYNIVFDWYIHPPTMKHKPAWFLPSLHSKNTFKEQLFKWYKNDF